jgi:hypothetical protein
MTSQITALQNTLHLNLKVKDETDFSLFTKEHVIPVVVHEFSRAATDFPIVFVKNTQTGQFQSVILTGLIQGENLYMANGAWGANFVPAVLKSHPFKLLKNEHDHDQLMMGIDEGSALCHSEEGMRLFEDNGDETAYLQARKEQIITYFEQNQITEGFIKIAANLDLFAPRSLTISLKEESLNLDGFYFIDEKKLNALPDDKFLDLKNRGFLQVIYSHLLSIHQIDKLAALKMKNN